ncbi:alpha/beta fold hydrolase [Microtetraspora malaysiensis]|uniref:alpha/beta fold hydrolase n=1 Tax=Microtetraspora malaysiensis TaxID=161358 RepID=UPI003D8BE365
MSLFSAHDGTSLAYHEYGSGTPLICLPGGPMRESAYLGELGGLSANRRLIVMDLRGTGGSATPEDTGSYRCDRQVDDVEALREHLGLERMDLVAHSAGANLAALYAARIPERIGTLVLVTPSTKAVGLTPTAEIQRAVTRLRAAEPWYPAASAALEAVIAGDATDGDWEAITPFFYGRWDAVAQAHQAVEDEQRNGEAAAAFAGKGAFDPDATRSALAGFPAPVLLLAGEVDLGAAPQVIAEYAAFFPNAELVVQPGGGHFPWLDDAEGFATAIEAFLTRHAAWPTR